MTTSKTPVRCKIVIDHQIVQQKMRFRYLGIEISSYADIEMEVTVQATKATITAASLNNTIGQNKHIKTEDKSRIYKTAFRPIMTYTAETRPETSRTK